MSIKITESMQKVAADILTQFMFLDNLEDLYKAWDDVFARYELFKDPFTGCPCSYKQYAESSLEYARQSMIEKYGHCDGL